MLGILDYFFGGSGDEAGSLEDIPEEEFELLPDSNKVADTSTLGSAFSDLIGSDSDFADLYSNLQDDPDYGTTDVNSFMYDEDDPFAWLYDSDPEFAKELLSDDFLDTENSQYGEYDWGEMLPFDEDFIEENTGMLGGKLGPKLSQMFLGDEGGAGILSMLLGGTGGTGKKSGGSRGILGNIFGGGGDGGGLLGSSLGKIMLAKYLSDKDEGPSGYVPIGAEAFGAGGGQQPSYQIPNLQPALLPGMAYANQPTTFNADPPPGMQAGGLASIPQGNKGLAKLPRDVRNKMGYMQAGGVASLENMMDGPGDITQAMLEPGEFVMTRKATENLTPEYLYKLMHQAENAGRMR